MSRAIEDSSNVRTSEPEYATIATDSKQKIKLDCEVVPNPSYRAAAGDVKVHANPAYHATS